jgi:hypothetical protein
VYDELRILKKNKFWYCKIWGFFYEFGNFRF